MTILIDIALFCAVRPFFYIVMLFLQQNKSSIFVQQETFRIIVLTIYKATHLGLLKHHVHDNLHNIALHLHGNTDPSFWFSLSIQLAYLD